MIDGLDSPRGETGRRRRRLENLGAVTFLALLVFWRFREGALLEVVYSLGDLGSEFLPIRVAAAQAFRHFEFLLWSPEIFGGYPTYAHPHTAVFYPLNWILSLVMPAWATFNYFALLHFVFIACSMFAFVRFRGLSLLPCVLAAVVFALNGNRIYDSYLFLGPIAYLPLIVLLTERALFEKNRRYLLFAILLNGVEGVAGSPPMTFVLNAGLFFYVVVRLLLSRRSPDFRRVAVDLTLFYGLSFALTAVQALPTRELAQMTPRAAPTWEFITDGSLPPADLSKLVTGHFIEYVGAVPVALALVAFLSSRHRPTAYIFSVFTVIAIVLCLGKYTPFYRVLFAYAPGFSKFRIPLRFFVWVSFGIAILAAIGLQVLLDAMHRSSRARPLALAAAALLLAATVVDYWLINRYQYDPSNATPTADLRSPLDVARHIEREPERHRVLPQLTKINIWSPFASKRQILEGNSPLLTRVESSAGYMPLHYVPYMNMFNRLDLVEGDAKLRLASFLNIGYLATDAEYPPGFPQGRLILRAAMPSGVRLFANPESLPRVLISNSLLVEPDTERAVGALLNGEWNPASQFQVTAARSVSPNSCPGPLQARVDQLSYEATRIGIRATTNCPAVLCLMDTIYPSWQVTVDGKTASLFPTNLIYRGVELHRGDNRVEFRYRPKSLALGVGISLVTLIVIVAALAWLNRTGRAPTSPPVV